MIEICLNVMIREFKIKNVYVIFFLGKKIKSNSKLLFQLLFLEILRGMVILSVVKKKIWGKGIYLRYI